jgi:hypothetical protein
MHNVGYVMRLYDHVKVCTFDKQIDALEKCSHQELSNLVYIIILFPHEYSPSVQNLIRHYFHIRFQSMKMPMNLKKYSDENLINKLKQKGYIENRLYESGADIVVNEILIGEID